MISSESLMSNRFPLTPPHLQFSGDWLCLNSSMHPETVVALHNSWLLNKAECILDWGQGLALRHGLPSPTCYPPPTQAWSNRAAPQGSEVSLMAPCCLLFAVSSHCLERFLIQLSTILVPPAANKYETGIKLTNSSVFVTESQPGVGLKSSHRCPYKRHTEERQRGEGNGTAEGEIWVIQLQAQESTRCCKRPRAEFPQSLCREHRPASSIFPISGFRTIRE